MGTSSSSNGPGPNTPLLLTWADPPSSEPNNHDKPERPPIPLPPIPQRFRQTRNLFSRYVSSGGSDRHIVMLIMLPEVPELRLHEWGWSVGPQVL